MLELRDLKWASDSGEGIINGISCTLNKKLTVITGPNGGGKTTLAKIIAGVLVPDSGSILLDSEDITKLNITDRAKKGIAYAFQQPVRFKGMTVRNLLDIASGEKLKENSLCALLGKVGLCAEEYIDREMDNSLSGGEAKRIEIATVLARNAALMVFDEPEAGIDLWSFSRLVETFKELRADSGGSLVIISHQERILSIADEIIVIADGKIENSGSKEEILPCLLKDDYTCGCPQRNRKKGLCE